MEIEQNIWGFTPEGEAVILYTMTNANGASIKVTNIGASIVSVIVPDKNGKMDDVILGYEDFNSYFSDGPFMGKTVGRVANRIGNARFTIDGKEYRLAQNAAPHHLHGGPGSWANKIWNSRVETDRVVFSLVSPDGDEKYPGEVATEAVYDWSDDCSLEITFYAKTSAPTYINMTNHLYFNLKGEGHGDILDHDLQLNASRFLITDSMSIPTGEMASVEGTPMDFRTAKQIGKEINTPDFEPLKTGAGYDQCWVIDNWEKDKLTYVGSLSEASTGRVVKVSTTQPGIQIYTGNWLSGCPLSRLGGEINNRDGVAMECQGLPDAPNKPQFPSVRLDPEDIYTQTIIYKFETK